MLFFRWILKSCLVTSEREPLDAAIAATIASAACAAYTEYGSGGRLSAFVKFFTKVKPAPFRAVFGRPATETDMPSEAAPAPCTTAETGVKPSGAMIFTAGAPADRSLMSLPPF